MHTILNHRRVSFDSCGMTRITSAPAQGRAKTIEDLFEAQSEGALLGLTSIQASLAECVQDNNEVLEAAGRIESRFGEVADRAEHIDGVSNQLAEILESTREQMTTMTKFVGEIVKSLEGISSIAQQTNILAINAAVEAARVGEAGAGFAVVATEVKTLSAQTESIVASVSDVLKRLSSSTSNVQTAIDKADQHGQSTSQGIAELNAMIQETNQDNRRTVSNIGGNNERVFVNLAKLDHVIWKVNTYLSVLRKEPVFQYVDYHNCRLGRWYYEGDGREYFSEMPSFGALERPHARVHEGTKEAFEHLDPGSDPRKLSQSLALMEEGSKGVFSVLDRMLNERQESSQGNSVF